MDDNGVQNGKGTKGADNHHEKEPVTDLQKLLTKVGAYSGAIDGWFGDAMDAAVKLFQDAASKGKMKDKDSKKIDLKEEDKLKGHTTGAACPETKKVLDEAVNNGYVVCIEDFQFFIERNGVRVEIEGAAELTEADVSAKGAKIFAKSSIGEELLGRAHALQSCKGVGDGGKNNLYNALIKGSVEADLIK